MKYFIPAENESQLKKELEKIDLNIDEVKVQEASEEVCQNFGAEKGFVIEEKAPERAARFTRRLLYLMGFKARVKAVESEEDIQIEIEGEDLGAIIGSQGKTLEAFQTLLSSILNRNAITRKHIYIDVAGYRKKRKESLRKIAEKAAKEALEKKTPVKLEPMNSFERKIIHEVISQINGVRSESEGEEPNRQVVIYPE